MYFFVVFLSQITQKPLLYVREPCVPVVFALKESLYATRFSSAGQFRHFTNDGTRMEAVFVTIEELKTVMNSIAICSIDTEVEIITFEVMSDHIHFLLEGELSDCYAFVNRLKHRLMNHYSRAGRTVDWRPFVFDSPIRIQDLRMLRNEIAYINRTCSHQPAV